MNRSQISSNLWIGIALVALNVILFNLLLHPVSGLRADLTEGKVFSLSPVTTRILENLDEEVRITAYVSGPDSLPEDLRPIAPEILNLLREFQEEGGGRVVFSRIEPEKDLDAEKEAIDKFGVRPGRFAMRTQRENAIKEFYLTIVVQYAGANHEKIEIESLVRQSLYEDKRRIELKNVEYEVTRAIQKSIRSFESKKDLFTQFPHKMRVRTFISPAKELPEKLKDTEETVQKILGELAAKSNGKFVYEAIPMPDDVQEQDRKGQELGLPPFSLGGKQVFYLWALMELNGRRVTPIPLVDPDMGGPMSEFDLRDTFEGTVRRLSPGGIRTIGLAQKMADRMDPMAMQRGPEPSPFDALAEILRGEVEVKSLDLGNLKEVPAEIDVLLVLGPRDVPESSVFAIDQFLMRGGRLIVCADRVNAELRGLGSLDVQPAKTGLEDLLASWGVTLSEDCVLDPVCYSFPWLKRATSSGVDGNFAWSAMPRIEGDGAVNGDVLFMAGVETARFRFPSEIRIEEKPGISATWLMRSSDQAWTRPISAGMNPDFAQNPEGGYLQPAEAKGARRGFGYVLEGEFDSYFADRPIPKAAGAEPAEGEKTAEGEAPKPQTAPLKRSPKTKVIVFSNDDWLENLEEVLRQRLGADYGFLDLHSQLIKNAIDWLSEDDELIAIRNRGRSLRPLDRIDEKAQKTYVWVNFTAPLLVISVLGIGLFAMRRNRRPLV